MDESPVLSEVRGRVQILTMNRPEKINAMDGALYELLDYHVRQYAADDDVRCLVITGAGGNFSSGGDLRWFQEMQEKYGTPEKPWTYDWPVYTSLQALTKPVIAAVDGYALASAFNLAVLYCDFRIASTRAKFGIPGPRRGLGLGTNYPMPWNTEISVGNILYLTLTGIPVSSERAMQMGLVSEIVEPEELLDRAVALGELIAEGSPREVAGLKEFWQKYPELPGSAYMTLAKTIRSKIDLLGDDREEGKRAFLEKRTPHFESSKASEPRPVSTNTDPE
ncbi:MAG: enoyl-CoA hydratase/isomerase family protein [Rhodoglobus sp.]